MIASMNVSRFVKICQVLTILLQLICRGVANFGTRCSSGVRPWSRQASEDECVVCRWYSMTATGTRRSTSRQWIGLIASDRRSKSPSIDSSARARSRNASFRGRRRRVRWVNWCRYFLCLCFALFELDWVMFLQQPIQETFENWFNGIICGQGAFSGGW